jgi:hypothetical protein
MIDDLRGDALLDYVAEQKAQDKSLSVIAEQLGLGYKALENRIYLARKARRARGYRASTPHEYKDAPFQFDYGAPWELTGDWCVVGDVHVPLTDYDFAQHVSLVASRYLKRPRKLLVAGDFWNFDTYSTYPQFVSPPTWQQEREAGRQMMREWRDTFDEIRLFMGNHDRRIQKWMAGNFDDEDMETLLKSDGVRVSNFGSATIKSPHGYDWRVTHPKNYSINQLVVAEQLALKYHANIISFHEHHAAIGMDRYKKYILVNGGCLVDPAKLAYANLDDSKGAGMMQAFVILRDGYPYLFADAWTDWDKWV